MKTFLVCILCATYVLGVCQNKMPEWKEEAFVSNGLNYKTFQRPYTMIVYGGLGCGYTQLLVQNLNRLTDCQNIDIVLLMNESKEEIYRQWPTKIDSFYTFSNQVLSYKLRKANLIFPQVFIFKEGNQLMHIKGIKREMFQRIKKSVGCD